MGLVGAALLLLANVSWGRRAKFLSTSHNCKEMPFHLGAGLGGEEKGRFRGRDE